MTWQAYSLFIARSWPINATGEMLLLRVKTSGPRSTEAGKPPITPYESLNTLCKGIQPHDIFTILVDTFYSHAKILHLFSGAKSVEMLFHNPFISLPPPKKKQKKLGWYCRL